MGENPFKQKNAKGRSFKTVAPHKDEKDDDGDGLTHNVAHRATKGQKPGTGLPNSSKRQPASYMERNKMGGSFKTVASKDDSSMSGRQVDPKKRIADWCSGKRGSYK